MNEEREERARRSEGEAERLGRELRYAQQTVAGELAGWRDMHERIGRRAVRELARGMVVAERCRLEGMVRALRAVREGGDGGGSGGEGRVREVGGRSSTSSSSSSSSSPLVDGRNGNGMKGQGQGGEGSGSW
jgi:hypothetical protein